MKRLRRWHKLLLALSLVLCGLQLCAKYYFGLGYLPLYRGDSTYEYIYSSNQHLYRFGKLVKTNNLGLRCGEPIQSDAVRILKIGDSVINGGPHVDQDNLSSTVLEKDLTLHFKKPIRVFNVSAQSWGPDNAFAFIKKHSDFGSKIFVLVFSSHDLHDNMHFKKVVGVHKAWPDSQPWCALTDGFNRYFVPMVKGWFGAKSEEYDYLADFDDSKVNPGWKQFIKYTQEKGIKLIVYHHATLPELRAKSYDKYGLKLQEMLAQDSVEVLHGLNLITQPDCYRDNIHLNEKGHDRLAAVLNTRLQQEVADILKSGN